MRLRLNTKKTEGWNLDGNRPGLVRGIRERLGDNTKLWAVCLVIVLALGVFLLVVTSGQESFTKVKLDRSPHTEEGPYLDDAHNEFVKKFDSWFDDRGVKTESRFRNAGEFEVIVPADTVGDDIDQASRWAAVGILRAFHNSPIVYVYIRDPYDPSKLKHATTTDWNVDKSDFVVNQEPGAAESAK